MTKHVVAKYALKSIAKNETTNNLIYNSSCSKI